MARPAFTLAESVDDLKYAMTSLAGRSLLALDLETEGLDPHHDKVVLLTVGDDSQQLVVDCRRVSLEPLRPLLTGPVPKVTHNGAFDLAMLRSHDIFAENVLDTMLNEQLIENGHVRQSLALASLSERYLGLQLDKSEQTGFARTSGAFSSAQIEYARRDVLATFQVLLEQTPRLAHEGLQDTARLEAEALPAFADLRYDGVFLDRPAWSALVEEAKLKRDQARAELDEIFKKVVSTDLFGQVTLNYESDVDLKDALQRLCNRRLREVNKAALRGLGHPVGEVLLRYRDMSKIVGTYGDSFLQAIHPKTGRIHADFRQIGAPTGRVACANPNLQNIPRGSRFRQCFRGPSGCRMVTADYAGCELRILAELSGDDAFVRTFNKGGDLHSIVASEIFGKSVSKSRYPELRSRAKAINFGLAYGMGAGGLAAVTGLQPLEAERLLSRYFRSYPKVRQYLEDSSALALRQGFARTIGGRKLYLRTEEDPKARSAQVRVAKNMPIQGTNADMLKVAMAAIRGRLRREGLQARMVNCVHDEILVEAPEGDAWDVSEIVREEMVAAGERYIQKVPVVVDVSVGDSWQK
jgi:DNA polymerase I